jgi:predicted house-cleaning noncanonical NTP pyrophosphatase (MazG superfamily)
MVKFFLNKIDRDKSLEGFKSENIIPKHKILNGNELCVALKNKLIEESLEIREANNNEEIIAELADVLELIDGL